MGVATCAVAAAATLTPAIAAQADIATPAPLAPVTQVIDNIAQDNWLQNQLWWIGTANPNPPAQTTVLVFTPLSLIPGFLKPIYKSITGGLNFQVCLLGASAKIGPYGTLTVSFGRGC
ncbi:hypothetical protein [Mycobacterium hackensackense]|uniref:hypothetical protein n=1 Tax=Mycobacterium hackensackense TaxID=228909 RepID=UPI002265EB09|nr:hypothetical protein [Mycobacterium hackensackense]